MRSTAYFTVLVMLAVTWAAPIHRTEVSSQPRSQDLGAQPAVAYSRRDFFDVDDDLFQRRDISGFEEDVLVRRDWLDMDSEDVLNRRDWPNVDDYLLYRREGLFDDELSDLFRRAGHTSDVNESIKAQGKRIAAADGRKFRNNRITNSAKNNRMGSIAVPVAPNVAGMDPVAAQSAQDAHRKAQVDRAQAGNRAAGQAMRDAQKRTKAQRTAAWAARQHQPGPVLASHAPPRTPQQRQADKQANRAKLQAAGQRLRDTQNLPHRKEAYLVPNAKDEHDKSVKEVSGKDVRKAVFNAYANQQHPVGQPGKEQPKQFNNAPYDSSHPDPNLQGQPTIPGLAAGKGVEYPVFANSPMGWTGEQRAGTSRVITENGHPDKFHGVIAHDLTRKGAAHDHYLVQKKP